MDIQLDSKTIERLSAMAAVKSVPTEVLAAQMLELQALREELFELEKADDLATLEAMDNGAYVENDQVMQWLDSWSSEDELPCPTPTK